MNKEEILAMSRNENKGKDIEKLETEKKAGAIAGYVACAVALVLYIAERGLCGQVNHSLLAIIFAGAAAEQWYLFFRKREKEVLAKSILFSVLGVAAIVGAILSFASAA